MRTFLPWGRVSSLGRAGRSCDWCEDFNETEQTGLLGGHSGHSPPPGLRGLSVQSLTLCRYSLKTRSQGEGLGELGVAGRLKGKAVGHH